MFLSFSMGLLGKLKNRPPFLRWFHQLVILCGMGLKGKEKIGRNPARIPHRVGQGMPEREVR
jgi:hypothetical protein